MKGIVVIGVECAGMSVGFHQMVNRIFSGGQQEDSDIGLMEGFYMHYGERIEEEGTRLGVLVSYSTLKFWLNDSNLCDRDGIGHEIVTDKMRLRYAQEMLKSIPMDLDADIHPVLLIVGIRFGRRTIVSGWGLSGYSFSGIDLRFLSIAKNVRSLMRNLKRDYWIVDDSHYFKDIFRTKMVYPTNKIILANWDRR